MITIKNARAPGGELKVSHVDGQRLVMYLRLAHLGGLQKHHRAYVSTEEGYFNPVRGHYVPKDGDVIEMRRVRNI